MIELPHFDWSEFLGTREVTSAKVIASYNSYGNEPSTSELNRELIERGKVLLLPRTNSSREITWVKWDGEGELSQNSHLNSQLLEPDGDEYSGAIDLFIVPALAVDHDGVRLGQGGGSYDRALANQGGWKIAVVYENELLDLEIPRESHDQRVDTVLTPSRLVRITSKS